MLQYLLEMHVALQISLGRYPHYQRRPTPAIGCFGTVVGQDSRSNGSHHPINRIMPNTEVRKSYAM